MTNITDEAREIAHAAFTDIYGPATPENSWPGKALDAAVAAVRIALSEAEPWRPIPTKDGSDVSYRIADDNTGLIINQAFTLEEAAIEKVERNSRMKEGFAGWSVVRIIKGE